MQAFTIRCFLSQRTTADDLFSIADIQLRSPCCKHSASAELVGEGYLEKPDEEDDGTHGAHHAAVVVQEGFPAAAAPEVELLRLVIVAVVSRVVGDLVLDARSRGAGVTAAEGDTVHQVPPVHVAFDPTMGQGQKEA